MANYPVIASKNLSTPIALFSFSLTNQTSPIDTGELLSYRIPSDCVITSVYVGCKTAPTGSAVTFDVEDGGDTILSAVLSIGTSEYSDSTSTFVSSATSYSFSEGDVLTVDCDQPDSNDVAREFDITLNGYLVENIPLFGFALTNRVSPITVAELKSFNIPFNCTLRKIYVGCKTAPTGSAVTIDVNDGTSSILSSVLSVGTSAFAASTEVFTGSATNYSYSAADVLTVDCDQKDSNDVAREFYITFMGTLD